MNKVIRLPSILHRCEDLQIVRAVQSTDQRAAKRHDVIDLVLDAGLSGQSIRLEIDRHNSSVVRPSRCGLQFLGFSLGAVGAHTVHVALHPVGRVGRSALAKFRRACVVLASPGSPVFFVALKPLPHAFWILTFPLSYIRALLLLVGLSLRLQALAALRFVALVEVGARFFSRTGKTESSRHRLQLGLFLQPAGLAVGAHSSFVGVQPRAAGLGHSWLA